MWHVVYKRKCLFTQIEVFKNYDVHLNAECLYFTYNYKNKRLRGDPTIEPSIQSHRNSMDIQIITSRL